jgi:hypothetical protein
MLPAIFSRLPADIINHIIPYTYNVQDKTLLHEIQNYVITNMMIRELYYQEWVINMAAWPSDADEWLINDLFGYANNYIAIAGNYIDKFYNIFYRNTKLKTEEDVDKYVKYIETMPVCRQINIFWALLTMQERKEFILNTYRP